MAEHNIERFYRTRLAPTPSGYLHLGNIFSFMLTSWLANKFDARILLRIDDIDMQRVREEYLTDIFESLRFMQIGWDEGPVNFQQYPSSGMQAAAIDRYKALLTDIISTGKVYACSCSRNNMQREGNCNCRQLGLPLSAENVNWRIDTSGQHDIFLRDVKNQRAVPFPSSMTDFVIRKKDGMPAYQVTSLADDLHFNIDFIVRGEDLLDSSLAQLWLAELTGKSSFLSCNFLHHPLLMEEPQKKLSKSAGSVSLRYLREKEMRRDVVINKIAQMLGLGNTIHTEDELICHFLDWQGLTI